MNHPSEPNQIVDRLLFECVQGTISSEDRRRLEALIRSDADVRERYIDYMSVEALLRFTSRKDLDQQIGHALPSNLNTQPDHSSSRFLFAAVASAAIAASILFVILAVTPSSKVSVKHDFTYAGWKLRPSSKAEISIEGNHMIQIQSGELYAVSQDQAQTLTVQTEAGTIQTRNGRFYLKAESNATKTTTLQASNLVGKRRNIVQLMVLAGALTFTNSGGNVEAVAGEMIVAQGKKAARKLQRDGNYREAYDVYVKLIKDPKHRGSACANDFENAMRCLNELGRRDEKDALIEEVVAVHPKDWHVLYQAAKQYWYAQHFGSLIEGEFHRANRRGEMVDVTERDRIRALQLMRQAMPFAPAKAKTQLPSFYDFFNTVLVGNRQLWNLQATTKIDQLPDYGDPVFWSRNQFPPVDEQNRPIFYDVPASWETASNDGERSRWLKQAQVKLNPKLDLPIQLEYANFLQQQYGVQTSGVVGKPILDEGQIVKEGRFTAHTLDQDETIARLATGIQRFKLPAEHNFIMLYESISDVPVDEPPNPLTNLKYRLYEGDWNQLPNFRRLKAVKRGSVPSGLFDLNVTRKKTHFAIVFEGTIKVPKSGRYEFDLYSDDGTRLTIDNRQVLENDGCHGMDHKSARLKLTKGRHKIRLEYFQKDGPQGLILSWHGPGLAQTYLSRQRHTLTPQERALQELAYLYEGRQQFHHAIKLWKRNVKKYGEGNDFWKENHLRQIVGNWVRFQNAPIQPAGKKANLPLHFRNTSQVRFKARRVRFETFLADIKSYLKSNPNRVDRVYANVFQLGHRLVYKNESKYLHRETTKWTQQLQPPANHWTGLTEVETPLDQAGVYLIEATANEGNTTRVLCWIADTTIVRKKGDQKHFYFVADASSGKPIERANVEFFGARTYRERRDAPDTTKTVNFSKFTDASGLVTTDAQEFDDTRYRRIVIARDEKSGRFGILGDFKREPLDALRDHPYTNAKAWAVSDRPVYRPGQPVHLKSWVRHARYDLDDVSLYAGREFKFSIIDPSGAAVLTKDLKTDEFGGANLDYSLNEHSMLGQYRFEISATNFKNQRTGKIEKKRILGDCDFRVEEYKKPEFEVTIESPNKPTELGKPFTAKIQARYYFGQPVSNAMVKYTVKRSSSVDQWFPRRPWDWFYGKGYWWWGYDYDWYPGWRNWSLHPVGWFVQNPFELVQENSVPIGKDGTVEVKIDTSAALERFGDTDHRYEISAEVVDQSRRSVSADGSVIAARNPFNVFVWMDGGHYQLDDQMQANVQARTPDGKGVKGIGVAKLFRVEFDDAGKPVETEIGSWNEPTDEEGRATLRLKAKEPGQYRLAYRLIDSDGVEREGAALTRILGKPNVGIDQQNVADSNFADVESKFRFQDLEIVLDKPEYKPGDRVRLLINTNHPDRTVLLFVRPVLGVYRKPTLLNLDGKSTVHEIEVAKTDMPNFHVEAMTVANGKTFHASKEVVVPPEKRILNLTLLPEAKKLKPGQTAKVKLQITDADGKPFVGDSVVSVYDKSLEAIAPAVVSDIRAHFWKWRRRHNTNERNSFAHSFGQLLREGEVDMQFLGNRWPSRFNGQRGLFFRDFRFGRTMLATQPRFAAGVDLQFEGIAVQTKAAAYKSELGESKKGVYSSVAIDSGAQNSAVSVRKNFADTAFWSAKISTDQNGLAEIQIPMPENLTTWKVKAWAMGHGTRVGHGESELITSKDVLIRLQAPRFFVENDRVTLSANVHNYTDQPHEFSVKLETDGDQLELSDAGSQTQNVRIAAKSEQRIDWLVQAKKEGQAIIRVKAVATDGSGDAMQQEFPVLVHGTLKTESWSRVLNAAAEGDEAQQDKIHATKIDFEIPEKRNPEKTQLAIQYSPSIALALVDALPYLAGYPYKNSEAAMSRFGPLVLTKKILLDMKIDLVEVRKKQMNLNPQEIGDAAARAEQWRRNSETNPIFDHAKLDKLVARSLLDLSSLQNSDGGWGWYEGHRSTAHSTAYVVHGLQLAKANGAAIVPGMLNQGIKWLENHQKNELTKLRNAKLKRRPWKSTPNDSDAFTFFVLTECSKSNQSMGNFLYKNRLVLSHYSQAMLGIAFHEVEQFDRRDQVIRNLSQFLVTDEENQTAYLRLPDAAWRWYWWGDNIEANAYYLKLLCRSGKQMHVASQVAKYLLNNRKYSARWHNTRQTSIAIEALAHYIQVTGESNPNLRVSILVDGELKKEVVIHPQNVFTFDNRVVMPGQELASGKHTVEVRAKGAGRLYVNAYLTNFTQEVDISAAGLELKVNRNYYLLESQRQTIDAANSRGNVVDYRVAKWKKTPISTGARLKSGDRVEVELLVTTKNDYQHLTISDRIPAGLEALEMHSGHRWLGGLSAYVQMRDERSEFFIDRVATGRHRMSYQLRVEIPGQFSALPATGNGVYAEELRANSDEFKLGIVDN